MKPTPAILAKSQFKCFHCRLVVPRREGNWVDWDTMQVHLCPACDKSTKGRPERRKDAVET